MESQSGDIQTSVNQYGILSERIQWIDIAKGIAIILVIIGHTLPTGHWIKNFIYSFHMPLFFILSGYTMTLASDGHDLKKRIIKDAKHLLLPCMGMIVLVFIFKFFISQDKSLEFLTKRLYLLCEAIFWSDGVKLGGHSTIGLLWFLVSLFYARNIVRLLILRLSIVNAGYGIIALWIAGMLLGQHKLWLPQNLDVSLVSAMFVYIGILWSRYKGIIDKYSLAICFASATVWIYLLNLKFYIRMAPRWYGGGSLTSFEAVCAVFVVCCFCMVIEDIPGISHMLSLLGRHTLCIFCVHYADWTYGFLWQMNQTWKTILARVALCLLISLIVSTVHRLARFKW